MRIITVYTKDGHIRTYELRTEEDGMGASDAGSLEIAGWIHDYEETRIATDSGYITSKETLREVRVLAVFAAANLSFYELTDEIK